jgi:tetratricopeptide (TPR) repeat protein
MPTGEEFEKDVAAYYQRQGYHIELTPRSHDFGADIILYDQITNKKILVQAKYRTSGNIGVGAVQEVNTALNYFQADEGWVVTNSEFTSNAIALARVNNISLIDNFRIEKTPPYAPPPPTPLPPPTPPTPEPISSGAGTGIFVFILVLGVVFGSFLFFSPFEQSAEQFNEKSAEQSELDTILQSANELLNSGQYSEAIERYNVALKIDTTNPEIYFNQGTCYGLMGSNNEAIFCFNKAIELDPSFAMAWNNMGVAYINLNKPSEASAAFTKAFSLDPSDEIIKKNYENIKKGQSIPKPPTIPTISNHLTTQTPQISPSSRPVLITQIPSGVTTTFTPTITASSDYRCQPQQSIVTKYPPMEFWGKVTVSGNPMPTHSTIVAKIGNEERGKIHTTTEGQYGGYGPFDERLKVYIEEDEISQGTILVTFWNNGKQAKQTAQFKPGSSVELNLDF